MQRLLLSRTIISSPPLPLTKRPILSPNQNEANGRMGTSPIIVVLRDWPGHQVLLVPTAFLNGAFALDFSWGSCSGRQDPDSGVFGR